MSQMSLLCTIRINEAQIDDMLRHSRDDPRVQSCRSWYFTSSFCLLRYSMLWDSSSIALTEKASRCYPTSMPVRTAAATRIRESKSELY
jgi:hypothetical protein